MPGFIHIDDGKCNRCDACIPRCPAHAITYARGKLAVDPLRCDGCGKCFGVCPEGAFVLSEGACPVIWVLAQDSEVSGRIDDAFAQALPGVGRGRIKQAAREVLDRCGSDGDAKHNPQSGLAANESPGGVGGRGHSQPIVAYSLEMGHVLQVAAKVAQVTSTVLVLGESGVGKEVVARFIHGSGPRREGPFISINCGAIPANLLESELFGYESGAFTGARREGKPGMIELAQGGTLFLDEISELPLDLQVKLLQVIQERRLTKVGGVRPVDVDIRIIAATNRDLAAMVRDGEFRTDLFYRLNVVPITIPPLRERTDDVIPLIYHFLEKHNRVHGYAKTVSEETKEALRRYSWPGNVRELENLIERLVVTIEGDEISLDDLPSYVLGSGSTEGPKVVVGGIMPLREAVWEVERQILERALAEFGSTYKVAEALGVNQSTIVRKLKKYSSDDNAAGL